MRFRRINRHSVNPIESNRIESDRIESTMRGNRARSDSDVSDYTEAIEYMCLCTPLWECVFDDYDNFTNSFTLRNRMREWKHERRSRSMERKEVKKQGKLERSGSLERIKAHKKLQQEKSKRSKSLNRAEAKKQGKWLR